MQKEVFGWNEQGFEWANETERRSEKISIWKFFFRKLLLKKLIKSFLSFHSFFVPFVYNFMHEFVRFLYDVSFLDEYSSKANLRTVWRSWINKNLIVSLFSSFHFEFFFCELKHENHNLVLLFFFCFSPPIHNCLLPTKDIQQSKLCNNAFEVLLFLRHFYKFFMGKKKNG